MKKIEEYLYNNGLDWTDIILYILMGVLIALAIVLIGVIVYGIWETVTAIRRGLFLYYNKMICKCYNLCYNIYSEFVHILICTNFLYMGILCKQSAFFHV